MITRSRIARWALVPGALAVITISPALTSAQTMSGDRTAAPASQTAPSMQTAPVAQTAPSTPAREQMAPTSSAHEIVVDVPSPSFIRPEIGWAQGLGFTVDTGGPGIRIERFEEDN